MMAEDEVEAERMTIRVTQDQVDNARLLMALDKARGRTSAEWIVRLANARPESVPVDPSVPPPPTPGPTADES